MNEMKAILTARQMKRWDSSAIRQGTPSRVLMERAARGVVDAIQRTPSLTEKSKNGVLVLCGSGNNGGDGFAVARFLKEAGIRVTVAYAGVWQQNMPDVGGMSEECADQLARWTQAGGETTADFSDPCAMLVVDAMLGIGMHGAPTGKIGEWIRRLANAVVVAVDIPSGVNADTGEVPGDAVRAVVTVTMTAYKRGILLYPGAEYAGDVRICDIGIPENGPDEEDAVVHCLEESDIRPLLWRPAYSNKGTFGRVLVAGGGPGMCGAPYLAGKAAYRGGVGLVEIFTAEENRVPMQVLLPEAVLSCCPKGWTVSDEWIMTLLRRQDAVVLGCGLGQDEEAVTLVEKVLRLYQGPLVLDADALNLLARHQGLRDLLTCYAGAVVMTPHLAEGARLADKSVRELQGHLFYWAENLSRRYASRGGTTCVLKDARTVISDGQRTWLSLHGNSGMATGGAGDCLAGVIGGILAQQKQKMPGMDPALVAAAGVWLHASAGDLLRDRVGAHAMMAGELADAVGEVTRRLFDA